MGASPSCDILQVILDHIFTPEEYPFVCTITDDTVIVGYDDDGSNHDRFVWQVLKTAWHEDMKFNPDKCMFCSEAIQFFGMILSGEGMLPDPKKTEGSCKSTIPKHHEGDPVLPWNGQLPQEIYTKTRIVKVQNDGLCCCSLVIVYNPNDPMLPLLDNSDSPSIVEQ